MFTVLINDFKKYYQQESDIMQVYGLTFEQYPLVRLPETLHTLSC